LGRVADYRFPVHLTATTGDYLIKRAALESGQTADDMRAAGAGQGTPEAIARLSAVVETNILLRSTCTATLMQAGHGESALPERAVATIQCRIMPGETDAAVQAALTQAIADPKVRLSVVWPFAPSPESPPSPGVIGAVEAVTKSMWPNVPVLPVLSADASDSAVTRGAGIASYGVDGMFDDFDDLDDGRAHGRDERIGVTAFAEEIEFTYRLMRRLAE